MSTNEVIKVVPDMDGAEFPFVANYEVYKDGARTMITLLDEHGAVVTRFYMSWVEGMRLQFRLMDNVIPINRGVQ